MGHIRIESVVFTGLLFLVFPLIGLETPCVSAKTTPWPSSGDSPPEKITPRILLRYLMDNAERLQPARTDKEILRLITLQNRYLDIYEAQLFAAEINPLLTNYNIEDLIRLRGIKEDKIKELVRNIRADRFILTVSEGTVYVGIDYPFLAACFGKYASRQIAGYLQIMARETSQPYAKEGVLKISPDALGRRIAAVETYLKENPRFVRRNEVLELGQRYLLAYFMGLSNTPAFNHQTNRLTNRFYHSYLNTISKYTGAKFAGMVKEYVNLLSENDFQKTKQVLNFLSQATMRLSKKSFQINNIHNI